MPDYGIKEYCGSCGAKWNGERENGWCCSSPGFMSSEFGNCPKCMGTGGEYPHAVCPHCDGTGETPEEILV